MTAAGLVPLPSQPAGTPWPTESWPEGQPAAGVDTGRLTDALDRMLGPAPDPVFGETFAAVVVHRGVLVAERYGPDVDATTPLLSWSMAKSVTHALAGILVADGRLDPDARAPIAEWDDPDDPRRRITVRHLLRMTDGLEFNEDYDLPDDPDADVPVSHCIEMLFGSGRDDTAGYAVARPLAHEPGTVFNYSSGTSNVLARIVGDHIGRGTEGVAWMHDRLFDPIGMASAEPGLDEAGSFVGSSYLHATARDFAKFGLLYLRGGRWNGRPVVPADWVDAGRTLRNRDADTGRGYGEHWWMFDDDRGTFWASGFEGQRILCSPATDTVVVRLGRTPDSDEVRSALTDWSEDVLASFDGARSDPTEPD